MAEALRFTSGRRAIVCIGINPTSPHTGYGYIHAGEPVEGSVCKVSEFKEKPCLEVAQGYLASGGYFWNAGIFVWSIGTIEDELRLHAPQICGIMDSLSPALYGPEEASELARLFPCCEKISIDYAVMEKSEYVHMIPGPWEWSDLGSFDAIKAITGRDPRYF